MLIQWLASEKDDDVCLCLCLGLGLGRSKWEHSQIVLITLQQLLRHKA